MPSPLTISKLLSYNLAYMTVLSHEQLGFEQQAVIKLAQILQRLETNSRSELLCIRNHILTEYSNHLFPDYFLESVLLKIEKRLQKLNY